MPYQSPRGTQDILPEEQPYWTHVHRRIEHITQLYGYERLGVPMFEDTAIFARGIGAGTDIVDKEMYSFEDRGGDSLTLRPEFTAGIVRAYIEHGMHTRPQPVRLYDTGSCFRYERPQAGRYREHHQLSLEALGEIDPAVDLEIMTMTWALYDDLGFGDLAFQINSIGCPKCRPAYIDRLVAYYREHEAAICEDCQRRLVSNPMRLLDCKSDQCQPIADAAPHTTDYLCDECREHFADLRRYLDLLQRPYTLNHRLARGLDYYTKTVFEVWAAGIGAQASVCGGGRYDVLAELLGGPPTPGVGVGIGIERIILTLKAQGIAVPQPPRPVAAVVYRGDAAKAVALRLLSDLRAAGVPVTTTYGARSFKSQMKQADKAGAAYALLIGDDEAAAGTVTLRDLVAGEQETVPLGDVVERLKRAPVEQVEEDEPKLGWLAEGRTA
ncbi:MAG: histidine--tRNA ligase [Chloroflexi bacterium]|nr:histidine--tRNA ligase [Chloroflexota bacterium]